nr:MAG TPA: repressor protein [Caudoviricetes sp.]
MEKSSGNISKIREIANERGMTLAFISKKLGKSSGYLSEISGRNADVPSQYLPAIAEILGTSAEYINGRVESPDEGKMDITTTVEYGKFQFQRFYNLCKEMGVKQAHLYTLVGMPSKAGSNLRKTKKVKPEILEVWARELHTSAAYLNGETDDPAAPEEREAAQQQAKEKAPAADSSRGVTDEDLKFALFGGGDVTDAQFEEVKNFARFIKERDANGQSK